MLGHQMEQQTLDGSNTTITPTTLNRASSPIKGGPSTGINDMVDNDDVSNPQTSVGPPIFVQSSINPTREAPSPQQLMMGANVVRPQSTQSQATRENAGGPGLGPQQSTVKPQIAMNSVTPELIQNLYQKIQTAPPTPEIEAILRTTLQWPDFTLNDPSHKARLHEIMNKAAPLSQTPRNQPATTQMTPHQNQTPIMSSMNLSQSPPPGRSSVTTNSMAGTPTTIQMMSTPQPTQMQTQQQQSMAIAARAKLHKHTLSANGHRIGRPPRAGGTPTSGGMMGPPQSTTMNNGNSSAPAPRSLSGQQSVMVGGAIPAAIQPQSQGVATQQTVHGQPVLVPTLSQIVTNPSQLDFLNMKSPSTSHPDQINMYAARIRSGLTNLMGIASTNIILGKRKRTQATVSALDELDLSDEESQTESDADGHRRRGKRALPPPSTASSIPAPVDPDAERKKIYDEVAVYLPQPGSRRAGIVPPGKVTQKATKHMYVSKEDVRDAAEAAEVLVPIRIEFEYEGYKIRDILTWNLNERLMSPLKFAEMFCEDLDIKPVPFYAQQIATAIQVQLSEYAAFYTDADLPVGKDARVKIQLDIQVGKMQLQDQFEWDLNSDLLPEAFSRSLVADLGLGSEFVNIVAHSIRDQIHKYRVSQISEEDTENAEPIDNILRDDREVSEWEPVVHLLNEEDLDKISKDRELKEAKKSRREVRAPNRTAIISRSRRIAAEAGRDIRMEDIEQELNKSGEDVGDLRCHHCGMTNLQYLRAGPDGPKTLCNSCAAYYYHDTVLPSHRMDIFNDKSVAQSMVSRDQW